MSNFAYSIEQIDKLFERANRLGQLRAAWFRFAGELRDEDYGKSYKALATKAKEIRRELRKLQNAGKKRKIVDEDKVEELKEELERNQQERSFIEQTIKEYILIGITNNAFRINVMKKPNHEMGKDMYVTETDRNSFFACKVITDEMQKSFKIPQPNRIQILKSLELLLSEPVDKIVVRCDIKHFFESIPRKLLISELENTGLLNSRTLRLIKRLFGDLTSKCACEEGIPRGIGFSPTMADFYLRSVDTKISNLPGVYYYRRYVDDIIVIASQTPEIENAEVLYQKIASIFEDRGLLLHGKESEKHIAIDLHYGVDGNLTFDYLGYSFYLDLKTSAVTMLLTERRFERYKEQIDKIFRFYLAKASHKPCNKNTGKRLKRHCQPLYKLHKMLGFLTRNYHLGGTKSELLSGIYFKHELLTDTRQLVELDNYLYKTIKDIDEAMLLKPLPTYWIQVRDSLYKRYSFVRGFKERLMCHMTSADFKMVKHTFNYETQTD